MGFFEELAEGYRNETGYGQQEGSLAMFEARQDKGKAPQATRGAEMLGTYRLGQLLNAMAGNEDPDFKKHREALKIPFKIDTPGQQVGSIAGAIQNDLVQDSTRRFWWLLNAAQAVGDVTAEAGIASMRPELYDAKTVYRNITDRQTGEVITKPYQIRKYAPGLVQLTAAPAGLAINTGLGLMSPFGGAEGYKAALPDPEDPSKTTNVLGEIAAKYFLGRTGDLLPYDEFVKVRPDVSRDEYQRYKAFKFDKRGDLNPFDDGQMTVPTGVLKYTDEGIHGPEIQFLGRSIPLSTTVAPFAAATAGAMAGVSYLGAEGTKDPETNRFKVTKHGYGSDKPIMRGVAGGMGGFIAGQAIGSLIEGERRRRNAAENERDTL